ncbi:MAG TPA: hypothetical protein VIL42_01590 [Sphingomicrobium sp.]|jgi:hypothetical protein
MNPRVLACALLLAPTSSYAYAQAATAGQPGPTLVQLAQRSLPGGTQVQLAAMQELSSKHITEGERYKFTVVNDVVDNGVVVIPRGSIATGVVTMKTGRAIGGKSGKFDITFESVAANGKTFPLMGVHRQEGRGNTVGALLGSILITGRSAVMLPGQIVTAMVKEQTAY